MTTLLCIWSCIDLGKENPYEDSMHSMTIQVTFPEGISVQDLGPVDITLYNINTGRQILLKTGPDGIARTQTVNGMYRVSSFHQVGDRPFNALEDRVKIAGKDRDLTLKFVEIKPGALLIKEIYTGGCSKMPVEEKEYQSDKYAILHNNSDEVYYLDSLCFGTLSPYNSMSENPWLKEDSAGNTLYAPFLPIIQALWRFGGDGKTFPLQPGEDAIIAFCGAIDHSKTYPESVNLNRPDCFVCYDHKNFPNPTYHPVPDDQILPEKHLELVIKTGKANAYTISVNSPTFVIFKAQGQNIEDFVADSDNIIAVPGSSIDKVVCVPPEWVIDGVEVFNGSSSENTKRLLPLIDAGVVFQTAPFKGRALHRLVDEKKSAVKGYEVLKDTNNSSKDFVETEHASLWKKEVVR